MSRVRAFLAFVWDFVVGDDWVTAAGIAIALGLTAVAARRTSAWWIMPIAVVVLLSLYLWRARRVAPRPSGQAHPPGE